MNSIDWVKGAVIYQIFPDSFARSSAVRTGGVYEKWEAPETACGFRGGNLKGAEEKLDYLRALGVDVIYFNPIFSSAANHRYHTYDYYTVDPVLGGNAAFDSFLAAAHRRGMKVILDGVFNHTGRGFFQFNHILENGAASPYRDWFSVRGYPVKAYNLAKGEKPNYASWWDLPALPKFNIKNPEVRRFIMEVGSFWLKRGIDGWRLDVPNEVNDDSFWREFRRVCKKVNPRCYITGEIWGDARRWLKGDQFDAVMNYQLSAACIAYFGGEKIGLSHRYAGREMRPIGQRRFIAAIEKLLGLYKWETTLVQMNMMSSHDTDRMADTYGFDTARVKLAVVFSFLFPGAVNVYYGEELGLRGKMDHGTRRGMPWQDRKLWDRDLLKLYKELAALRRGNPVTKKGRFAFIKEYCDGGLLAFKRFLPGGKRLVCFMNNSGSAKTLTVAIPGAVKPGISSGVTLARTGNRFRLAMAPRSFLILAA